MNRRGFLGLLGGAAAAVIVGEIPSSKTFFLPPAGGWRPSDFDTAHLRYKAYERYSEAWTDPRGVFGLAPLKPEGDVIAYDDGISLTSASHPVQRRLVRQIDLDPASFEDIEIDLRDGADHFLMDDPQGLSKSLRINLSFGKQGVIHGQIEGEAARGVAGLEFRRTAQVLPDHRQEPRQSGIGSDRSRITGRTA